MTTTTTGPDKRPRQSQGTPKAREVPGSQSNLASERMPSLRARNGGTLDRDISRIVKTSALAKNLSSDFGRHSKPNEDRLFSDPRVDIVADGTTKSPVIGPSYPSPSPSAEAAQVFVAVVKNAIENSAFQSEPLDMLRHAFSAGNQAVSKINADQLRAGAWDYLYNDLAGVVAAATIVQEGQLHFAQIGDAKLYLFRDGELHCLTENQTEGASNYRKSLGYKSGNPELDNQLRVELRSQIRNNPDHPLGFGVITGEASAMSFVRYGTSDIRPGDYFFLATDGLDEYLAQISAHVPSEQRSFLLALQKCDAKAIVDQATALDRGNQRSGDDKALILIACMK